MEAAEDPLAQLADIHLPGDVSFWPPAPGWWMLVGVLLLSFVIIGRHYYRQGQVRRRLNSALYELDEVFRTWQEKSLQENARNQAGLDLLYGFNAILKRVALVYHPQTDVAKLTGTAWLRFLDAADDGADFTQGAGKVLSDGTYRPVFSADVDALHTLTKQWIMKRYLKPKITKTATNAKDAKDATGVSA